MSFKKEFNKSKREILIYIGLIFLGLSAILIFLTLSRNEDLDNVKKAYNNLKEMQKYQISTIMQAPDGNLCYVEICNDGTSYTEYSIDADGNFGTVAYQDSENIEFTLTDWVTSEGKGYMLVDDDTWVSYPDNYSQSIQSRDVMYFDKMVDHLGNIEFKETVEADIGMGAETIDIYEATLSSSVVADILGLGSSELYECLIKSSQDENIDNLCEYYLDDINFTMYFSNANITVGVVDDVLRYVQMEVGGLGTRLYYTKAVLTYDIDIRPEPDFSNVATYESTMKELADYVAKYDSYEEAMLSLSDSEIELEDELSTESATEEVESSTEVESN